MSVKGTGGTRNDELRSYSYDARGSLHNTLKSFSFIHLTDRISQLTILEKRGGKRT